MRKLTGAVLGVVAACVSLGVAHLVATFVGSESSPVIAVGSAAIDLTPEWLKSFAIRTFGEQDKIVLLAGVGAVTTLVAIALGLASVRRPRTGLIGLALLAAVALAAALTRPTATALDALPSLLGAIAGAAALLWLHSRLSAAPDPRETGGASDTPTPDGVDRRRFVVSSGVVLGVAAAAAGLGQFLSRRKQAEVSRAAVTLPEPGDGAGSVPGGVDLGVDGLSPYYTPNGEFYRVDTALIVPSVPAEDWNLRVHGMVSNELTFDFEQLMSRPLIERDITLACVSNEVGGPYVGNARWVGAPLADLLDEAGVDPAATQLVSTAVDGFTIGTPVQAVTDGRDAMLAIGMNGEPLPVEHGFPVRMVVPGLYGYVSATKWVVDLELTTFDAFDPYWIRRGWAEQAPIKTQSRIDTPKPLASVPAGDVVIAGVAWAQHTGIEAVEVRIDGGEWQQANLASENTIDTWRQWKIVAKLAPGNRTLAVRATDASGATQTAERAEPFPDGATGQHSVVIQVG
ncbi:MAG TPA: molybdopterin-dependent oxidoreductase [Actinomycetota bacterium]